MINTVSKKLTVWFSALRQKGLLEFIIMGLQFIQKHINKQTSHTKHASGGGIYTKARYQDIIAADPSKPLPQRRSLRHNAFAWIMPPPGKGSGGHLNIFRFIKFLEDAGYDCSIYLYVDGNHGTISAVRKIMGDSYPKLQATKTMRWLETKDDIKNVDGVFATSWETAYAAYTLSTDARRFYFIQDFEPYFYPVGGMYTLAENTYRLGFYGITAGGWLKQKLAHDYSMQADSFDFASDPQDYRFENQLQRKEIFYYARPYTERRGFEVGILALDLFHRANPEYVINIVGWDVSEYNLPFPYKNIKTLEVSQLSRFYNKCVAGLVLSYTNMSLLPLELLRCGTIPVVNDGPNNRLVSDNPYIAYAANTPHALAAKLSEIVSRGDQPTYAAKAAESVADNTWTKSGRRFVKIIEKELNKHG